ncbi:hypothetical protein DL766_009177 [Monosporascus sp. MC13-8B]|uniref:Lysine--tRNA ligase n=1 Tax=Monosporascus cannonballus TaxID=155416 RepID=A0ABY0HBF5_9PEZI|nr:hypothetical protein DL762_004151 [Monosporascus cannonballus]RYO97087.1 hypothetical protein DL763_002877 [Monosporascus cannonballus]RYP16253.1 hypothetical protein DL766_009177 [Monosporascus sp. MC13-8B]
MGSMQGLYFLRPFIFSRLTKDETAYARFFSAACNISKRQGTRISAPSRCLHNAAVKAQPETEHGYDAAAAELSHSATADGRIQKLKEYNALQYPRISHQGNRMSIPKFRHTFENVTTSAPASEEVLLQGRIMSIRASGSKLVFMDISGDFEKVQVMISLNNVPIANQGEFKRTLHPLLRGDIVSVTGTAMRTSSGELSLKATTLPSLLSPCVAPLPEKLINEETRILKRHVDLLVNRQTADILRLRSYIIKYLRNFFHERDFLEVQTPLLADYAGGAAARPFLTSATEFPNKELALRIAPELWLKRLVVGGMNRVFEIGPAFRNEGLDTTHNPEFTICEFYSAYSNLQELMAMTESLIRGLLEHAKQLKQRKLPTLDIAGLAEQSEGGWGQVEFIPALEDALGIKLPNLSDPDALEQLTKLLEGKSRLPPVEPEGTSLNKLLDHLASTHLEGGSLAAPLFITHHPACMAPLAKSFACPRTGQLVSARAELFVAGREIANMYEEENDPFEQRRKFELQARSRVDRGNNDGEEGDGGEEGQARVDESYVRALEHGLPPTGGWGCGVDRLVMVLSGATRIADVLSFGSLRNVVSLSQAVKK